MSGEDSRFDFIIYGGSGFTGTYVIEELARTAMRERGLRWAVAGRNETKLRKALSTAAMNAGIPDIEKIPIVIADNSDPDALKAMAEQAKVVLNCVGPYRFFGEPVIQACLEAGAHHVDISGEPQFLESMQLKYGEAAREKGVYIVGSCGFDSIPAEMGILYTKQQFNGELNSVESFLNIVTGSEGGKANTGTWQSAIYGFAHRNELKDIRRKLFKQRLPNADHRKQARRVICFSREVNTWCLPFPGSDRSVVRRTQRHLYEESGSRPLQYHAYFQLPSLLTTLLTIIVGTVFGILASCKCGRYLLEKFPGFFSGGIFSDNGPSRSQVSGTSFTMTFLGEGWAKAAPVQKSAPRKHIMTCVSGPEPGYIATPICMIQAGLTILKEKDKMPDVGGVYPPGAAFWETNLIQRLQENRIVFMVIKS